MSPGRLVLAIMETGMKHNALPQWDPSTAGPLYMLSAGLLFTTLNIIIKLLRPEFTVWHIGFFRFFGGLVVLYAIFGRSHNFFKQRKVRLLIIRGCTGAMSFIALITAIRLLPLSTAMVIFYAFPAFSAIFSFFLFGERIRPAGIVCIVGVIAGVAVLFDFQVTEGIFGQALAVLGSVFAGMTVTLIRTLRQYNGPVAIYLYFCIMGSLVTLPGFLANPILPADALEWLMIVSIVVLALSAQLLINQGFAYLRGWEGGVFMSTEVMFTAAAGIVFLGDPVTLRFWLGGGMILGSGVILNRFKAAPQITS